MGTVEFNNLLLNHSDFLRPFAINLTRDSEAANDLFQDTLFKALSNKDKYNAGTNIRAWLYTIMRNIFINNYRRNAKQRLVFDLSTDGDYLINREKKVASNEISSQYKNKENNNQKNLPVTGNFSSIYNISGVVLIPPFTGELKKFKNK